MAPLEQLWSKASDKTQNINKDDFRKIHRFIFPFLAFDLLQDCARLQDVNDVP
jgi:hypothetical protein